MDERKYGFKHIAKEYSWMTPGWIEELLKHEPDEDVRYYIKAILEDLTNPEKSRLESSTDNFDSLEEYSYNRLLAYGINLEEDPVYEWLLVSKDFFAKNEAFELCYNIQKALDIIKRMIEGSADDEDIVLNDDGLPF